MKCDSQTMKVTAILLFVLLLFISLCGIDSIKFYYNECIFKQQCLKHQRISCQIDFNGKNFIWVGTMALCPYSSPTPMKYIMHQKM